MIWFIAEDKYYYEISKDIEAFKTDIGVNFKIDKIVILPTIDEIKEILLETTKSVIISNEYPPVEFSTIFIIERLQNKHGILTTQEKEFNINEAQSLYTKLGLKTIYSTYTFKDLGGAITYKDWSNRTDIAKEKGHAIKPVFLLGVPGVGKSFSVACYAGEKNIPMMELNISLIAESKTPIKLLHRVFEYLSKNNTPCVLLIDEIEQMLTNKAMLGQLLTILNDLNTSNGYTLNGMLFATSNNISDVAYNFPQFLRHGRWSEKFFANYPTKEEAIDIIMLYARKFGIDSMLGENKEWKEIQLFAEYVFILANQYYKSSNIDERRSVYAPSEISYLFEKLTFYKEINSKILTEEIEAVQPLQKTTHNAIHKLLSDAQSNAFKEM